MSRLWVREIKHHRVARHTAETCAWDQCRDTLVSVCRAFDIPAPMWLDKHEREFNDFRRTAFTPDHFVETIDFDRLEIEYLADDGKTRKSRDPRNDFG